MASKRSERSGRVDGIAGVDSAWSNPAIRELQEVRTIILRELGRPVYNPGVRDACRYMQDRLGYIEGEVYEPDCRK